MTPRLPNSHSTANAHHQAGLSAIQSFAQISATVLDLDDLLIAALDILSNTFGFDVLAIILVDDETGSPKLAALNSPHQDTILTPLQPHITQVLNTGVQIEQPMLPTHLENPPHLWALITPLTIGQLVIGALVTANSTLTDAPASIRQVLSTFASQVTVAITNANLYKKSRGQQQQELIRRQIATHLQQLSTIINATLDLDDVLNLILEHIAVVIPYDYALIMLLQGHKLEVQAVAGLDTDLVDSTIDATQNVFYQQVLLQKYPAMFGDVTQNTYWNLATPTFALNTKAWIGAPLVIKSRIIGLLTLHHTTIGYFNNADLELVHTFANQAAIAIDNAQLYHREQEKVKQFQIVAKIGRQATEIREIQLLLDTVAQRLHNDLGYDFVSIFLYQGETDMLLLKAASDRPSSQLEQQNYRLPLDGPGAISTAARTEEALLLNDVNAFTGYFPGPGREQVQSELAIPLMTHNGLIGVLDLQSKQSHTFSPDDVTLVQTVSDQLAVAIETANLFKAQDQRLAELAAFNQIGLAIADPSNPDQTLRNVLTRIQALYQVEGTSLMLLEGDTLRFKVAVGIPQAAIQPFSLKVGEGFAGWVAQHKQALRIDDVANDPRHYKMVDQQLHFKTRKLLAVPVQIQGRVLGVIEVMNRLDGKNFTQDDEVILSFIASATAITIENAKLLAKVTQLFNNLQQHTQNLEETLGALRKLHRQQNEFVQNVSHELRTPLTFIRGYVDLILEDSMGTVPPPIKKSLEVVSQRAVDLSKLVENLVTYQQLAMDIVHFKETDLVKIVKLVTTSAMPMAKHNHITLTINIPKPLPTIIADPDRIRQVFDNLIGNALKFTPQNGTITISAHRENDQIKISIEDTGVGIPAAALNKIFDRFYQVEKIGPRKVRGSGLGLTIVKQIIETHHGTIDVASKPGEGTRFTLTLPITQPKKS